MNDTDKQELIAKIERLITLLEKQNFLIDVMMKELTQRQKEDE